MWLGRAREGVGGVFCALAGARGVSAGGGGVVAGAADFAEYLRGGGDRTATVTQRELLEAIRREIVGDEPQVEKVANVTKERG